MRPPYRCGAPHLANVLQSGLALSGGPPIDGGAWGAAPYQPTPTIIEAARALYARHSVDAISRSDAGAKNLRVTSLGVEEIIERSRTHREKSIVFVTGGTPTCGGMPTRGDITRFREIASGWKCALKARRSGYI